MMKTHLTWSIESPVGQCPYCGDKTVLVVCGGLWEADKESTVETVGEERYEDWFSDGLQVEEEVTGHYCGKCARLTSLSLNT